MKLSQLYCLIAAEKILSDTDDIIRYSKTKMNIEGAEYDECPTIKTGEWHSNDEFREVIKQADEMLLKHVKEGLIEYRAAIVKFIESLGIECDNDEEE